MIANMWPALTSRRHAPLLSAGLIALVALAGYARTGSVPWLLDDASTVVSNPSLEAWPTALRPPADSTLGGRPFANLTFTANRAWGGNEVLGYHVVNLAIHVAAGLVFFGLVRRTLERRAGGSTVWQRRAGLGPDAATGVALASAIVWISHPLLTVSVTYVSQRTECLMGLCYLGTLYTFIRGSEPGSGRGWLALSVAACAAGMATKESMVTAPVLVLLYDRIFVASSFAVILRQRAWYYAGLAATWVLLGALMMSDLHLRRVGFGLGVPWWTYALTECSAVLLYLRLSVWPNPLVFDYGPIFAEPNSAALFAAALLAALAGGALLLLIRRPRLGFAACAYLILLAPTSSVIPIALQPIAENRVYLPLAALVPLGVLGLRAALGRASRPVIVAGTIALTGLTLQRNEIFREPLALWADTLAKRPLNPRAYENYGYTLRLQDRAAESLPFFGKAIALNPASAVTHGMLGDAHLQLGQASAAVARYEEALRLDPSLAQVHGNLGGLLAQDGRTAEALAHFQAAVRLRPLDASLHSNLGLALAMAGQADAAAEHYRTALRLRPDRADTHVNYANLLLARGQVSAAEEHYRTALRLHPNHPQALQNLENLLSRRPR